MKINKDIVRSLSLITQLGITILTSTFPLAGPKVFYPFFYPVIDSGHWRRTERCLETHKECQ